MAGVELTQAGQFTIRVRKADWEIEVSAPDRAFVLEESNRLIELVKANVAMSQPYQVRESPEEATNHQSDRATKPQTLNEFLRQFKFSTNLDRTLALGYWLEIRQRQAPFTPEDMLTKYKEAKEPPPANIRRDLKNLVGKGLLLEAGKSEDGLSAYELTTTGIKTVESMISLVPA